MRKKFISLILCISLIFGLIPFDGVIAVSSEATTSEFVDYSAVIGNTAEFNEYYPIPISDAPEHVTNPWGTDCEFISEKDVPDGLLLAITHSYCSADGSLWYKVIAAPGYTLPQKLQNYPWIYQDNIYEPLGESLKIHDTGINAIFDADGNVVTSISMPAYDKMTLLCRSSLRGTVAYQWQVCCDTKQDLWVNVFRQTSAAVTINYGMLAQRVDEAGFAHIRCVSTVGEKTVIGEDIPVQITQAASVNRFMAKSPRAVVAAEDGQDVDNTTIYNIIIEYVFPNGTQAANPWTATIEAGGDFKSTIKSPEVVGYAPDQAEVELDIQDIREDLVYTVTYEPSEVDFIVSHQMQNTLDDNYTEFLRIPAKGYTDSFVGDGLTISEADMAAKGIYALPYDIEQKIAADGTTEVVIKYDRYYYLMNFVLNGGYNVEPIYARVGTPISVGIPIRAGYVFRGWDTNGDGVVDSLPATMPMQDTVITAVWEADPNGVNFFIAYWQENANDDGKSIARVDKHTGVPGTTYSGSDTYGDMPGFHFDHADPNVLIKGDGSTVVNVYYKRNRYALTFAYEGGPQICGGTHNHNNCSRICGLEAHTHNRNCCTLDHWIHYNCSCEKPAHTHTDSCYDCGKVAHNSHSAANGCYGVKFEGIKYGEDTSKYWSIAPSMKWNVTNSGTTFYTAAPAMPDSNLTIYGKSQSGSSTIHYYERVNGQNTTTSIRPDYVVGTDGWSFTSEDYIYIPGFSHVGQNKNSAGTQYYIYYQRNSYNLSFKNGDELIDKGNWLYEADLSNVIANDNRLNNPTYTGDDPDGFTFGGWYTDESCIEETKWDPQGATMPYNKMMLYAKWVPIQHQIRLYITKEDYEADRQYLNTIVVSRNNTAQKPATPANGSYHFVGWFYMEDGVEKAYDFSIPVRKDMDLYGKWYGDELVPYTVRYAVKQGDQIIYIANDTTGNTLAGYDKTFEAKSGNELYEGYRTGYYPETNSHSMNVLMDADNTYTFFYIKKEQVKYTVRYLEAGTETVLAPEKTAYTTEAVHTENFVFVTGGYRPDAYQKRLVLSANEDENVITFWYIKDAQHAPVLVKHYLQNVDGTSYNTTNPYLTTTDLDGLIGANYTVDIVTTLEGFQFKSATASHEVEGVKTNVPITINSTQVSARVTNEGLLIELYYDRIFYPYEFRFLQQGTNAVLLDPIQGTARYGSQATQAAISIPGYTCTSANQSMTIQSENSSAAVKNVRIFYYVEQTVTIQYVPVGEGTTTPSIQTNIPVISGIVGGSVATPDEGYLFKGWYSDAACTQLLTTDLKFMPAKNAYGQWQPATYYARFEPHAGNLTIVRTNASDSSQVYVYEVKNSATGEIFYATIAGNGQVTIKNLLMGEYTVTQQNDWSWRYDDSAQNIAHRNVDGTTVTFGNSSKTEQWLNGNSQIEKNQRR